MTDHVETYSLILGTGPGCCLPDVLQKFDSIWDVKGLIVTHSNLKVRPQIDIIVDSPGVIVFCLLLAIDFSICAKKKTQ